MNSELRLPRRLITDVHRELTGLGLDVEDLLRFPRRLITDVHPDGRPWRGAYPELRLPRRLITDVHR